MTGASGPAILVVSCDRYSDLWRPFFSLFFRYWPECPWPVYLLSNEQRFSDSRVRAICVGPDAGFSANLLRALEQVTDEWVVTWVEDRPPIARVDTELLMRIVDDARRQDADYLKLLLEHPLAHRSSSALIGAVPPNFKYRVSLTVALWRRTILLGLLRPGETPWEIELHSGPERALLLGARCMALSPRLRGSEPIRTLHLVLKGRVFWRTRRLLRREGLAETLSARLPVSPLVQARAIIHPYYWALRSRLGWATHSVSAALQAWRGGT